ncbi:DUF4267 domain-containing protein [Streptomyces sp. NPDC012769]|uniref:DUF4267 domain-containing protein n=1 Tax=Streptomyces sp. NPDC012769 TaxID=3364848 RepID=UPI0036B36591
MEGADEPLGPLPLRPRRRHHRRLHPAGRRPCLLSPETTASGFGLPSRPSGDGDDGGFLVVKGVRDVVLALVLGVPLVTGHRRALAWVLLVEALVAYGDMTAVLAHHGSTATRSASTA